MGARGAEEEGGIEGTFRVTVEEGQVSGLSEPSLRRPKFRVYRVTVDGEVSDLSESSLKRVKFRVYPSHR